MTVHPLAGQQAPRELLANVPRLARLDENEDDILKGSMI
jgi:hypothetical protein